MNAGVAADTVEIATEYGLAALAVTALAVLCSVALWVTTRPRRISAGPAVLDGRDERPAIVDLLTGGFDVDRDAVPATVIDLGQRGHFSIDQVGDQHVLRRRRHHGDPSELTAYEQRVLDHIDRNAIDGVTPTAVLTLGEHGVSERWFRSFRREVTAHARELDLCRRRWGVKQLATLWGLVLLAFVGPITVAALAPRTDDPAGWGSLGNLAAGIAFVAASVLGWLARGATVGGTQVDTSSGRDAARHWLGVREFYRTSGDFGRSDAAAVAIWDHHLAYATAMGLAPEVERQIPFGAEHDRKAWSNMTGQWRKVHVSYRSPLPCWGQHPGRVAAVGAVQSAIAAGIAFAAFEVATGDAAESFAALDLTDQQLGYASLSATLVTIVATIAALYGISKVGVGIVDLFRRRTVVGLVLRRRDWAEGLGKYAERIERRLKLPFKIRLGGGQGTHHLPRQRDRFVAVDDGSCDRVRAYRVDRETYRSVTQGAMVEMRVSPILGHVSEVTVSSLPTDHPGTDRYVPHELVADALGAASAKIGMSLSKLTESLEQPEAQQLLDETDEDGVTLRDRLAESRSQLDRARREAHQRDLPIAGLLDALADGARSDEQ